MFGVYVTREEIKLDDGVICLLCCVSVLSLCFAKVWRRYTTTCFVFVLLLFFSYR